MNNTNETYAGWVHDPEPNIWRSFWNRKKIYPYWLFDGAYLGGSGEAILSVDRSGTIVAIEPCNNMRNAVNPAVKKVSRWVDHIVSGHHIFAEDDGETVSVKDPELVNRGWAREVGLREALRYNGIGLCDTEWSIIVQNEGGEINSQTLLQITKAGCGRVLIGELDSTNHNYSGGGGMKLKI